MHESPVFETVTFSIRQSASASCDELIPSSQSRKTLARIVIRWAPAPEGGESTHWPFDQPPRSTVRCSIVASATSESRIERVRTGSDAPGLLVYVTPLLGTSSASEYVRPSAKTTVPDVTAFA